MLTNGNNNSLNCNSAARSAFRCLAHFGLARGSNWPLRLQPLPQVTAKVPRTCRILCITPPCPMRHPEEVWPVVMPKMQPIHNDSLSQGRPNSQQGSKEKPLLGVVKSLPVEECCHRQDSRALPVREVVQVHVSTEEEGCNYGTPHQQIPRQAA